MKTRLTIAFLCVAAVCAAQRKEMRTIEKALEKGELQEAYTTFESIDESSVETKYAAEYNLYKAAHTIDIANPQKKVSLEDLRSAEEAYEKAKSLNVDSPQISGMVGNYIVSKKLEVANTLAVAGKTSAARDLVDEIYQMDTQNYDMLYNSANLSYASEDLERALEDYDKLVIAGYTGSEVTYVATNTRNGQEENFPNEKTRALAVKTGGHSDPKEVSSPSKVGDIATKLVWLYKNSKGLKAAESSYERIQSKYPGDTSLKMARPNILLTLEKTEEYEKAAAKLKQSIDDPAIYENLAMAAFKNKDYDKAIENFEAAIDMEPSYAAYVNLANSYIERGNLEETTAEGQTEDYKKAVENFEAAHKMKPEEKNIISTLASLYEFLEMPEKAEAMKAKM